MCKTMNFPHNKVWYNAKTFDSLYAWIKLEVRFESKSWSRNLLTNQIRLSSGLGHDFTKSLNKVVTDTKVCNY